MPPLYDYVCNTEVVRCPYCGVIKTDENSPEGCCGESSAHFVREACLNEYTVFYTSVTKAEIEEADERCPSCSGKEKERLISTGTSHILKGKWFKQGY